MIGSVRSRLTLAVMLTVGGLTLAAALIAPRSVRTALVDDRLDAEFDQEAAALDPGDPILPLGPTGTIGTPELTTLFGPEIAALTDALTASGTLARLRTFDPNSRLLVTPMPGVVGTVEPSGRVRVEQLDPDVTDGPLITISQLERLATELGGANAYGGPFEVFADESLTFEDFLANLDARFGPLINDRLDDSVFEGFPQFEVSDGEIPRDVFDILQNDLFPAAREIETGSVAELDDYVFGVRSAGDVDVIVSASSDGIERSVDRVSDMLWISMPVLVLLSGALTWLLAGRALRPVRAITSQTTRIRSSTLHERVPVPRSRDEVAGLATEMNTMLDRVQREDARRRQFVADASHELRSPIAAVRTQAEAALATAGDEQSATAELAAGVLAEAERMGTLVDDLLALARHDEQLAPPGVLIDLDDIVLAEAKRPRRLAVDVGAVSAGQVRGRPDELARVVTHLLDNAVRHADQRVAVSLDTTGGEGRQVVRLAIDDDGPGVPLDRREQVFERFVRLDEARQRDGGGAGLGLAVVASVVASLGGQVAVSDSDLGGARFVIELPAAS